MNIPQGGVGFGKQAEAILEQSSVVELLVWRVEKHV